MYTVPNPVIKSLTSISTWYKKISPYDTKTFGTIQRFQCKTCSRTFGEQTFSINYYGKKIINYSYINDQINDGSGLRKIARNLNVSPRTIRNKITRIARNAIILHESILHDLSLNEDCAADGFESFCASQYFPDNYNILVGSTSQFVYYCNYVTLRRKGRMTDHQKKQRENIEKILKAPKKGVEYSFRELCQFLEKKIGTKKNPVILYTDEKKDYQRALWNSPILNKCLFEGRIRHHQINSKIGRTMQNPLFPVNYMDREFRKDMAAHARESVQFNRNVNDGMLRMSLYLFDHNYIKPYRVTQHDKKGLRHAEVAGVNHGEIDRMFSDFFTSRFFWKKDSPLDGPGKKTLNREWVTPLKKRDEIVWKHLAA